jgi:hypothetical protein
MILYEYAGGRGHGAMSDWMGTKEAREHSWYFEQAVDRLSQAAPESLPGIVAGPLRGHRHLYKLRLGGKVRLRPLLCKGPLEPERELTFLLPAFERDGRLHPADALAKADRRRQEILFDDRRRRPFRRNAGTGTREENRG